MGANSMISAFPDRRSENVRVLPVIIAELKFGDIERHIFAAHFVKCADHATLEDRPKAFDGLCMDRADDIIGKWIVARTPRQAPARICAQVSKHFGTVDTRGQKYCGLRRRPRQRQAPPLCVLSQATPHALARSRTRKI